MALKKMEPVYYYYPWKSLLKTGTNGVATSDYGRKLMYEIMMVYNGDKKRYAQISGHNSNTDKPEIVNNLIEKLISQSWQANSLF